MTERQPQIPPVLRQRLDKWLFFTRLQKSRSIAQKAIEGGDIRVNDARVTQPSHSLKGGDIVTLSLDRRDVIVRMLLAGTRRGPYEEARLLYEDLTPPADPKDKPSAFEQATRERGSGRPTKKERRETDRLMPGPDWHEE
ncbi:RNA-binding S4 domain-containing protein [Rhizobium sp. Root482]|jgi:ribosome-associated heat shock protein Hsp15|uniref:RNA-binding S4 domain-containing protein n=1 Tax=Rhizobium sp. Root482 TaxID=1736543 RepID=UPI0006F3D38E|nr:RNA-binding S4 domain-containing protein [Rhizobium sp. Root482]KQY13827.1 RNA-binding protein [Rhizobium sp. Root482]